ncbi:hypothetical protein ACWE42_16705 [Sutcliffiella cohnii]
MDNNTVEIDIPYCYVWLTEGFPHSKRINLFRRYVIGFVKISHPTLEFVSISGMKAVCKVKEKD